MSNRKRRYVNFIQIDKVFHNNNNNNNTLI